MLMLLLEGIPSGEQSTSVDFTSKLDMKAQVEKALTLFHPVIS